MTFGVEKREWWGYPAVKNVEDTFIRFDTIYERDGRTHTDTAYDSIGRARRSCIALRGKN